MTKKKQRKPYVRKVRYWDIEKAQNYAKEIGIEVSKPTLIKWCKKMMLGFQLGGKHGKWFFFAEKYKRYLHGGKTETGENPNIIIQLDPIETNEEQIQNKE